MMNEEQLPPTEAFFSSLTNSNITDTEYAQAKEVWSSFNQWTMRDYDELYMMRIGEFNSHLDLTL